MRAIATLIGLTMAVTLAGAMSARAEEEEGCPSLVQIVALDECDPDTFNAALGEGGTGFCHNVALSALGQATTLDDLFTKAAAGTPDPGWDFEPDSVAIKKGDVLSVVNQGGEPHTFTEVAHFGGGFIPGLNHGENPVPECAGGFKDVAVARTRILQGSHLDELLANTLAAVNRNDSAMPARRQLPRFLADLNHQLAGRRQHESLRPRLIGFAPMIQKRQQEGRRFARAGLRLTDDVAARQGDGNERGLNRGGFDVTSAVQRRQNRR